MNRREKSLIVLMLGIAGLILGVFLIVTSSSDYQACARSLVAIGWTCQQAGE